MTNLSSFFKTNEVEPIDVEGSNDRIKKREWSKQKGKKEAEQSNRSVEYWKKSANNNFNSGLY